MTNIATKASDKLVQHGLTSVDADQRLKVDGPNELPSPDRRTPIKIILEVLKEPMFLLLLGGGAIYLALGSVEEAVLLLAFASLSILITVVQETRTERVLEALRDLTSPRALVIRDGERRRIAGRDVVQGDLLVLAEGDRVAADALLLKGQDLLADESLLTGESAPVRKTATENTGHTAPKPGGDDLPYVFSGSLVVRGQGFAVVKATGIRSEIGKIGQALREVQAETPHLQKQLKTIVRIFGGLGMAVAALVVVLYGLLRGGWLDALLAGIAIGMSMLPEEFPVVLTVFMAMGAWRISQARVLTRRASAIETLGSATVLCTDKTGTLTVNRMSIAEMRLASGAVYQPDEASGPVVPEEFRELLDTGILGSAVDPHDPMERAFREMGNAHAAATGGADTRSKTLIKSYGLRPELLAMSNAWQHEDEAQTTIATKGAPEAIADLCHLDEDARQSLRGIVDDMASRGMRVLGVAKGSFGSTEWPKSQHDFTFSFVGLVGLADPLRPSVPEAVRQCQMAGIKVAMITGDYPATARTIARSAGLTAAHTLTGDDLDRLSDEELAKRIGSIDVFARIMPNQKLRLVEAFKRSGEIVAMTGDGVNDAPSLKAAHIGIAMGGRGTDVAREASSIVLLDDDFGSVVKAISLGRRIYDNLRKAMGFILAVHIPIGGLALLPLLTGYPLILGPIHIAFLEMIIDPVCSLVFEAESEEDNVMKRPPRKPSEPLFSPKMVYWGTAQGFTVLALVGAIFALASYRGLPSDEVRSLTFFCLVLSIVGLIFVNRSFSASIVAALKRRNRALQFVLLGITTILALILAVPMVRELFRFGPLHSHDLAITAGCGILVFLILDLLKLSVFGRDQPKTAPR